MSKKKKMQASLSALMAISALAITSTGSLNAAVPADPTPAQIASDWATVGGGKDGFVVYNLNDDVYLLTLKTGEAHKLVTVKQAVLGTSTDWGKASALKISPDGRRVAAEGAGGVFVFNIDGTGLKNILPFTPSGDQISINWDGNDKVVYSPSKTNSPRLNPPAPYVVNSTVVNPDNSPGETTVLWSSATDKEPSGKATSSMGLVSIGKSGDYLSFDLQTSNPNIPIIVKLSTKEAKNPTNGGDGCQIRMWPDSSGTVSYHVDTHLKPANLWNFSKGALTTIPMPTTAEAACGNGGFNWAYDKNFMIQTGDNDIGTSPGCITAGRIRKTTWDKSIWLGDKIGWPDLYVGTVTTGISTPLYETLHSAKSQVWFSNDMLNIKGIEGKLISDAQLVNLSGKTVSRGKTISGSQQFVTMSDLPQGVYVLTWKESGVQMSRHVNILSGFSAARNVSVSL